MQSDLKKIDKKLDSLADIMTEGFGRLDERIDGLEVKVDGLEVKVDRLDGRMGKIEGRVKNVESELTDVRIVQGRHTQTLAEHTVILKRLDGDTEMLIEDDLRYAKRIKKIEKLAKLRQ